MIDDLLFTIFGIEIETIFLQINYFNQF